MATYELPEDLAKFLEQYAKRIGRTNGQDVFVRMVDDMRTKHRKAREIKSVLPKSYAGKKK